jgi:hypothetical protein
LDFINDEINDDSVIPKTFSKYLNLINNNNFLNNKNNINEEIEKELNSLLGRKENDIYKISLYILFSKKLTFDNKNFNLNQILNLIFNKIEDYIFLNLNIIKNNDGIIKILIIIIIINKNINKNIKIY